ncbi:PREDICTED: protein EARLY FLOWERING 4-like [Nelumbo nucifera]|uniref:Protein EARLY FLOWERING 4-like n=1 Tax=Nelumbo nucifera TaxID=4432 RepID=A0A1U8Q2V8_NELNU|nr:PREDICTED: protein EARLY FLOWERING 4-like [Nelumbo nucifera]
MTTIDSSSAAESSMDKSSNDHQLRFHDEKKNGTYNERRGCGGNGFGDGDDVNCDDDAEGGDMGAWETLSKSFRQVQTVLDQNRALIQQVNENHQSKIPDNLTKNVALIREINGNISKVISLYSDLSTNFTNIVHQRRGMTSKNNGNANSNNSKGEYAKA